MIDSLVTILGIDSLPNSIDPVIRTQLIDQFLLTADYKKQDIPHFCAIGGGSGSGKSYFYDTMKAKGLLPLNSVLYDPDLVMLLIPQYQEEALQDPAQAFKRWELPSRQLANELLLHALIARHNITYLRSFALPDSLTVTRYAKSMGYTVDIHLLRCTQEIAISRVQKREQVTKRHIPIETVIQRHEAVTQLLPDIKEVADNYFIYENNTDGFEPILKECSPGQ